MDRLRGRGYGGGDGLQSWIMDVKYFEVLFLAIMLNMNSTLVTFLWHGTEFRH